MTLWEHLGLDDLDGTHLDHPLAGDHALVLAINEVVDLAAGIGRPVHGQSGDADPAAAIRRRLIVIDERLRAHDLDNPTAWSALQTLKEAFGC
jgi:hypothetical protein